MTEANGRVVTDPEDIAAVLAATKTVAVLGIKTEAQEDTPAFYVPKYLVEAGLTVYPVPVYYPEAKEILGLPVRRRVADVPRPLDMVNVFRRARDLEAHYDDIVAAKPCFVWIQLGIKEPKFAQRLAAAGITVVQDRCLMVDHRAWAARR